MTQKQASLSAFHNLNRHRENSKAHRILQAITASENPLNDRSIAVKTGIPINEVESLVCKLEHKGEIVRLPDTLDHHTGNRSRVWKLMEMPKK